MTSINVTYFKNKSSKPYSVEDLEDVIPKTPSGFSGSTHEGKESLPCFVPAIFKAADGGATLENLLAATGLCLDFDLPSLSIDEIASILTAQGLEATIFSSPSNRKDNPRYKVVLPYKRPLLSHDLAYHQAAFLLLSNLLGPIDPHSANPVQKCFIPTFVQCPDDYCIRRVTGHPLDPMQCQLIEEPRFLPDPNGATPPIAREHISESLFGIDSNLPYNDWIRAIAATVNLMGKSDQCKRLLESWSRTSKAKYVSTSFEKAYQSINENHSRQCGYGTLTFLKNRYPAASQQRPSHLWLPGLAPSAIEAAESGAREVCENVLSILRKHGNKLSKSHTDAIFALSDLAVRSLLSDEKHLFAVPLGTGMGKTSLLIALAKYVVDRRPSHGLLISANTVDQLEDIRLSLIDMGVPSDKVGVLHSKKEKECVTSINRNDADRYQVLLVAHNRIRSGRQLDQLLLQYHEQTRLLVWDEALISAEGFSFNRQGITSLLGAWAAHYALRSATAFSTVSPTHNVIKEYLKDVQDLIAQIKPGDTMTLPHLELDIKLAISAANAIQMSDEIGFLLEVEGRDVRFLPDAGTGDSIVGFRTMIPDEFDKAIILDASASIRLLLGYDDRIEVVPLQAPKDYSEVEIKFARTFSSRTKLESLFRGRADDNYLLNEVTYLLENEIPEDEEVVIFTYRDRSGENYQAQLERAIPAWKRGKVKFCTWGRERGVNTFSNCKYGINIGLTYRDRAQLAGTIIGQQRNLRAAVSWSEVEDVLISEQVDTAYQAISRLYNRKTFDGKAGSSTFYFFHANPAILHQLKSLMPGVSISIYEPMHLELIETHSYRQMAHEMSSYLDSISEPRISTKKLRAQLKIRVPPTSPTWRHSLESLSVMNPNWRIPNKEERSFVRI